jgi:KaiC/GvpD/RAD55 family RecA-like ATPase
VSGSPGGIGPTEPPPPEWLPPELARFLSGTAPQTFTVRGPPGAGKTTFALAVLEQFNGYRAFVSARVPRASILRDHPWVTPTAKGGVDIVESLRFRGGPDLPGLRVGQLRDALQARASDLVELTQVLRLPRELEESLAAHNHRPKLVTIDSWEAWVENTLGSSPMALDEPTTRWELERSLLDVFRDAGIHTMLIVEREDRARLDYVTDGALSLTVTESDGRAERWISFQKLRGTPLSSLSYPFTLEAGRFHCIQPAPLHAVGAPVPDDPDPGPGMPGLWPGSTALATRFGRLPIPGASLFEADGETPVRLLWRFIVPIIAASLRSGGRVAVRPPIHLSSQEIWKSLERVRADSNVEAGLRILSSETESTLPGTPDGPFLRVAGEGLPDARRAVDRLDSAGFFRSSLPANARSLVVIFVDSPFEPTGAPAGPEPFMALAGLARRSGSVATVLVARTGDAFIQPIRARASLHLLFHSSRGQYFLTGIRPWTPHFALTVPLREHVATVPYELVRIV